MDNEKMKGLEANTPNQEAEVDSTPITADDLIKRLKSNLKQNPKLKDEAIFEEEATAEAEPAPQPKGAQQLTIEDLDEFAEVDPDEELSEEEQFVIELIEEEDDGDGSATLEEVAEPVEEAIPERKTSITDSIKSLIASLKSESAEEAPVEEAVDQVKPVTLEEAEEPVAEETVAVAEPEEVKEEDVTQDEAVAEEEKAEEPVSALEPATEPEKEYSVVIEKTSDKTNVFDPALLKKKKSDDTESLFEENDKPEAVAEAEQLTFSMTEDDLQKSIEEAEAFIFEREHIDNPEEVINDSEKAQSDNLIEEPEKKEGEYDQTDLWIASAFGDEDEVKNMYGEEEAQKIETQLDLDVKEYLKEEKKEVKTVKIDEEFTSTSQAKEIFGKYKKEHKISLIKIAICFVILFAALIYENISTVGGHLPGMFNQQDYPAVYILGSLQLLVLAAAVAWEQIYKGIRALLSMKPLPESLTAVAAVVSAVYHLAQCFISETDPSVALYVFPSILCIFMILIYDFFNLKREIYSFNIVASKRIKYTITKVDSESAKLENEAFRDYLSDEDEVSMFKIGKTGFVKGFYERMNSYAKNYSIIGLILSVAVALGLVFFIVTTVLFDVKSAFTFGYLAFLLAIPSCALLSFSLPFYKASKKAFDDDSAIIGDVSLDEYANANTLSFDDKDVFPSYGVKVKSIKVYGESRIDMVLYNCASVFKKIGGPLADVFDTATREIGNSEELEIIEIAKDGIETTIDGHHVYVGKASYIKSRGYTPVTEPADDSLEESGEASIMYMVCDDVVSAKIYVQYTIDPDFEFTLRKLYKAGICIGIKTFDPNIDDRLLGSKVKITKYPVRILRCSSLDEATVMQDEADSGIVSKGGPKSLLNTFVLCSKVLYANRTNVMVKMLSIAFSVVLMVFLLIFGKALAIPSIYVVLYQLFWMVPVYLISKFYV